MNSVNAVIVKKFFEITLLVHFMMERNHSKMLNFLEVVIDIKKIYLTTSCPGVDISNRVKCYT